MAEDFGAVWAVVPAVSAGAVSGVLVEDDLAVVEVVVAGKINCQKLSSIIIMYSKSKLSNGATVITVPVKGTEAATVLTLFPVGSRYEKEKQSGLSHFIEHMMFKGTLKRPSTLDISQELDKVGAEYNAYTSRDYTGYYVKASFEHLDLSLDLLSDMLWGSQFKEEELEKEKGVIVEELNMYKDNPTMYAEQLFEETLYANHPLGRDVGGLEKTVRQMTRKEMVGYYESFYQPQNMILVVAGRIDSHLKSKVIKFFGSNHHKSSKPIFKIYKQPEKTPVRLKSFYKKTDQAHLALGFPSLPYLPNLGPNTTAPAKPTIPPIVCTTPDPAKSKCPIPKGSFESQPPPQTQWP